MNTEKSFRKEFTAIALPVTLQCLLQSSFGVVDQIMTGQLGSVSIAGIGLAGKFASLFSILVSAVSAVAGIMIAQDVGRRDRESIGRSYGVNLTAALGFAAVFTCICVLLPERIMGLYSGDGDTVALAAGYLRIFSGSFFPLAVSSVLSALMRCLGEAALPLYTSVAAAVINTGLNYVLIFGKLGIAPMGARGAAIASAVSQLTGCVLLCILYRRSSRRKNRRVTFGLSLGRSGWRQYLGILMPILVCEFFWSLGENVYGAIYGHIGTRDCAAMTLTVPVQTLMIGALSGVSQAAGILIGKSLGSGEKEQAYKNSKRLMVYGLAGSFVLSLLLVCFAGLYVQIFRVEPQVRETARKLLLVFALISPVKVQNMVLGGGILRSGGRTQYVMAIDLIGTWIFGVPLGLLAAFVWKLPIPAVYFLLSLEEGIRLAISLVVFKRRRWMRQLV